MKANRLLSRSKRFTCVFLSSVLLFFSPLHALVTNASVTAVAAGTYAVTVIMAACGILVSSDTLQTLMGSFTSEAEYLDLGAKRQLGVYAQRIYDNARNESDVSLQKKFLHLEMVMLSSALCSWGDSISGIQDLAADMKEYLGSCIGLTNKGAYIRLPAVPVEETWGVTEWSSGEKYPLPTGLIYSPSYAYDPSYTHFLTVYALSAWSPQTMNIQNWYFANTLDIFGFYDAAKSRLSLYKRDAEKSAYAAYYAPVYSAFVNEDGSLKYETSSTSGFNREWTLCTPMDAGALPFPVFSAQADVDVYVSTGEIQNAYVAGTITAPLEGYRSDVLDLANGCISDVFTVPANADLAAENLGAITDVYPAGAVADVQESVKAGGIPMDLITDVPATGTISDVLSSIAALPGSIAQSVTDALAVSAEDANELTVPEIISNKFPFCIPFDFAYLMSILAAEPETPQFVIPFRFDYDEFHISYDIVVDLSFLDELVAMIRIMLDILFCASLMLGTRSLIRG